MTGFIQGCLYVFAGCAARGLIPAVVLAAKAGRAAGLILAVAVAVFVVWVLLTAAGGYR